MNGIQQAGFTGSIVTAYTYDTPGKFKISAIVIFKLGEFYIFNLQHEPAK